MLVVSGSRVGIGTNDPDHTLHVQSDGTTHIKIQSEDGYEAAIRLKAGTGGSTYIWTPGNTSDIRLYAGGADRLHVDSDGNVGIGTTSPDYNLHVASATSAVALIDGASNTDAFLRFGQNGTLKSYIKQGSGGNLVIIFSLLLLATRSLVIISLMKLEFMFVILSLCILFAQLDNELFTTRYQSLLDFKYQTFWRECEGVEPTTSTEG